jgi:hypothetical protein
MSQKIVTIRAHEFDCLPGHAEIIGSGSGGNLRVALSRAVQDVASDDMLRGRRPKSFKMSVVIRTEN